MRCVNHSDIHRKLRKPSRYCDSHYAPRGFLDSVCMSNMITCHMVCTERIQHLIDWIVGQR